MTRLTNAFSKKVENHAHAMALHFLYYNFVRVHKTLQSPAMAAGVTKRLWEMSDVVDVLEAWRLLQLSNELAQIANAKSKECPSLAFSRGPLAIEAIVAVTDREI